MLGDFGLQDLGMKEYGSGFRFWRFLDLAEQLRTLT